MGLNFGSKTRKYNNKQMKQLQYTQKKDLLDLLKNVSSSGST